MPLSDHVSVTVRRVRAAVSQAGFGSAMAMDAHRLWEDRTRAYASLAALQTDGSAATDTIERLATSYFGQEPKPERLLVGRRDTGDTVWVLVDDVASGLAYQLRIGGLTHRISAPPTASAEDIIGKLATQVNGGYEITAVVGGAAGTFTVAGDRVDEFPVGQTFDVFGSTGNDGLYTVTGVALVGGNTVITVANVASAVADGHIGGYAVTAVATGAGGTFTTPGDIRSRIPVGTRFQIRGSSNNDNLAFTVASLALTAGNTVITVASNQTVGALGANGGGIVSVSDSSTGTNDRINATVWDEVIVDKPTTSTFTLTGDFTSWFVDGLAIRITGSTGSNGAYTVASSAYNAGTNLTTVTIDETGLLVGDVAEGTVSIPVLELNPDTASEFYTVHGDDRLRLRFAISNSASADLTTIRNSDDDFYGVALTTRLWAEITSLAAAVEAVTDAYKLFLTGSGDANIIDTTLAADDPVTGSVAARLRALSYLRSGAIYSGDDAGANGDEHGGYAGFAETEDDDDPFIEAAIFGKMLPVDPGASTWNLQELAGIVADSLTGAQRTNALAKNANIYATITSTADGFQSGTVADANFIDTVRGLDWFRNDMETRVFNRLHAESNAGRKVPYTDQGFGVIEAEERASVDLAIARGVIVGFDGTSDEPSFTTPTRASQSAANRAARLATGFAVNASLAGAIHRVEIDVEVQV